jgi:hypothetical protein
VQPHDEVELETFLRAVGERGVHIVFNTGADGVVAAALFGKALRRAGVPVAGLTAVSFGERVDSPAYRAWLSDTPALLLLGLGTPPPLSPAIPQYAVDGRDEPLPARAFRLAETMASLGDASWCAAIGLLARGVSHWLVERALARYERDELEEIAGLLDAAARGPEPATESLVAAEMLVAAPDPRRFVGSVPGQVLRETQELVRHEVARASRIRPRPGFGVVVVEYDSPCHIEDLVAERWRGLRPGTVVLVANHGCVDGHVAVAAKCAVSEALDRLRSTLGDEGATVLDRATWSTLTARLGVAAAPTSAYLA